MPAPLDNVVNGRTSTSPVPAIGRHPAESRKLACCARRPGLAIERRPIVIAAAVAGGPYPDEEIPVNDAIDSASGAIPACWFVYILECRDGSLYTGIAIDVARRYAMHVAGKGARYTRAHPPARVLATFPHPDRAAASRAEYAIKQLSPGAKRALCIGKA
jgi:putative endonuclease